MKDPATAIRTAYFALLNGMTVSGKVIKVYDSLADSDAIAPYIIIKAQQTIDDSTKTGFSVEHYVTLAAVSRWVGNTKGRKVAEEVASAALDLIRPSPGTIGLPQQSGFRIITATLQPTNETIVTTDSGTDFQKLLTIKHLIQEL